MNIKVYIATDLEGVAGVINSQDYAFPSSRYYEVARKLTIEETNAAIEGSLEAGADDILVLDGHGHGAIEQLLLHLLAKLFTGSQGETYRSKKE